MKKKEKRHMLLIRFENGDFVKVRGVKNVEVKKSVLFVETAVGDKIFNWQNVYGVEEIIVK